MDYESVAKRILQRVGGKENVVSVIHCMTRLRFNLKDESIVDDEAVKKTKGVMGVMKKAGQYQIIIGNDVANVYKEICKLGNFSNQAPAKTDAPKEKRNIVSMLMDTISGIMTPVIPAIIGAAMIKVLLTLLPMIGILDTTGNTYNVLNVIGDGAFFFMPVLIAVSAAQKFGTNVYYSVSIALVMLHPNFISMMNDAHEAGETIYFLKFFPVSYASYSYSVIPIILAVWSLKYVEKLADKITPVVTKNFLRPMIVMLIEAPIALSVLGPIGAICGNVLSDVVYFIHDQLGFIAVGLIAGIYPFVVMAGMHHAFTPIKLGMIATTGFENFVCIGELYSNMAQGAASAAVAVKSKNKDFKQVAGSSAFSALLAGITEPALYGVTLRLKHPMLGACIGAAVGGLVGGFFQLKCFGIATPAIVSIVQYVEKDRPASLLIAALTILLTVIVSFIATLLIGFEDVVDEDDDFDEEEIQEEVSQSRSHISMALGKELMISAPLKGRAVPLTAVNDSTFSSEVLGKGAAIEPEANEVVAPFFQPEDAEIMKKAAAEITFMGVNYYQSCVCEYNPMDGVTPYGTMNTTGIKGSAQEVGIPGIYKNPANPFLTTTDWDWSIDPVGLRYCCREITSRYALPIVISENGLGAFDKKEADDSIHDDYRIHYLEEHIKALADAISEGCEVIAYCTWSFTDLLSWLNGYQKRYGFVYVDREEEEGASMARYKKDSYFWYQKVIQTNGKCLNERK